MPSSVRPEVDISIGMESFGIFLPSTSNTSQKGVKRKTDPSVSFFQESNGDSSSRGSDVLVASVVENRAREVCMCRMNSRWVRLMPFCCLPAYFHLLTCHYHRSLIWTCVLSLTGTPTTRQSSRYETFNLQRLISSALLLLLTMLLQILLHDSSRGSVLSRKIVNEFQQNARVVFISRQYFDQDRGAETLRKVSDTNISHKL